MDELIGKALRGEDAPPLDYRVVRRNGEIRWVTRAAGVDRDADGKPLRMIVTHHDVTDRKRIAEALDESQRLLSEATRAAKVGIFVHDHRTQGVYWSPEQRQHYGVGPDEPITYELFLAFVHPEDRDRVLAAIDRVFEPSSDGRFDIEYRIVRRGGDVRWIKTRGLTAYEGDGAGRRPMRSVGAVIDISDTKEFEERLRRSEAHLAQAQAVGLIGSSEYDFASGKYYRSDEFYRIMGVERPRPGAADEPLVDFIVPEDRDKI